LSPKGHLFAFDSSGAARPPAQNPTHRRRITRPDFVPTAKPKMIFREAAFRAANPHFVQIFVARAD
jgi:hypothetical protein